MVPEDFPPGDADAAGPDITLEKEWTRRALWSSNFIDTVTKLFLEQTLPCRTSRLNPKNVKGMKTGS